MHDRETGEQTRAEAPFSRAEYFAERELLIEARQRSYQRLEQMVTGGATGALVLSITFLEELAPAAIVRQAGWLVGAWILLLGTLSLSLVAQYASARAFDCEIVRLEATVHGEALQENVWASCNRACGIISTVLFVCGIAALARFAYINAPFYSAGQ